MVSKEIDLNMKKTNQITMKWISIIILLLFSFNLVLAECSDSDNGKNKYDFGTVTEGENIYEDKCSDNNIKEYFCSMDGIAAYTVLPCVNGCKDGECQIANEQPIYSAPEISTNYKLYFYGLIGILIIAGYIYLFKIRKKKSSKGFLRRKHNLEEY